MNCLACLPGKDSTAVRRGFDLVHPEDLPEHRARVDSRRSGGRSLAPRFSHYPPSRREGGLAGGTCTRHARPAHGKAGDGGSRLGCHRTQTSRIVACKTPTVRKDEFLATLAHELRNPLAPLRNGLQIARLTSKSDSPFQRTIEMMDRQLTHLVHLVDDLLDVGRISSGKIELRRAHSVTLSDILRQLALRPRVPPSTCTAMNSSSNPAQRSSGSMAISIVLRKFSQIY